MAPNFYLQYWFMVLRWDPYRLDTLTRSTHLLSTTTTIPGKEAQKEALELVQLRFWSKPISDLNSDIILMVILRVDYRLS